MISFILSIPAKTTTIFNINTNGNSRNISNTNNDNFYALFPSLLHDLRWLELIKGDELYAMTIIIYHAHVLTSGFTYFYFYLKIRGKYIETDKIIAFVFIPTDLRSVLV